MAGELPKSGTEHPHSSTQSWPLAVTLLCLPGQLQQQCSAQGRKPTLTKLVCGRIHLNSGLPEDSAAEYKKLNPVEVLFNTLKMYLSSFSKTVY
jgi:hypothetical protein